MSRILQSSRFYLSLFLVVFIVITAPFAVAQTTNGPALWKIEKNDSTIYLFGSFHMLKKDIEWQLPHVEKAFDEATTLTLEVSDEDMRPELLNLLVRTQGIYPQTDNIENHISQELMTKVVRVSESLSMPLDLIRQFRPWYLSIIIAVDHAFKSGFLPEYGVEDILTQTAQKRGLNISGLETPYEQMNALSGYNDAVQVEMLEQTIADIEQLPEIYDRLAAAWLAGDETKMAELMIEDIKKYPDIYDKIFRQRNLKWIPKITDMLDVSGVHLVVVGAAHLVGDEGVVSLLQQNGYEVTRQ